jgi:hypothetical protein
VNSAGIRDFEELMAQRDQLLAACKAVLACDIWHDHNGHAYLRVDARSVYDLAAQISIVVAEVEGSSL